MKNRGFTLFIAIVITATLLLVSTGIISVAVKEAFLTAAGRESQHAFYAADSGVECALYWDVKGVNGVSAFSTTTSSTINCNSQNFSNMGGAPSSIFTLNFPPDPYCAVLTVTKTGNTTKIESLGYNTCDITNPRRVERAVRVSY